MMSYPCGVCFRLFIVGCSHLHSFNFSMNMPVFLADDRKNFEPMRGPLFLPKACKTSYRKTSYCSRDTVPLSLFGYTVKNVSQISNQNVPIIYVSNHNY